MLSFMRENEKQDAVETNTMSDLEASEETQERLTVSGHEQRVRQSTVVFAVLFVIGVGALFFMVKKAKPMAAIASESKTEEAQIEAAITRLTGVSSEMMTHMDEIVDKFHEFENVQQIGVGELTKNPFSIEVYGQTLNLDDESKVQEVDPILLLEQQVKERAQALELLSILRESGNNRCMIDDTICRVGDVIKGFTVLHIGFNQVELQWATDENEFSTRELERLKVILKLTE